MSIAAPPAPFGPTPAARQLAWHAREFYGFLHFTTNTFTDKEWGYGDEDPQIFNPSDFDADAIARVAKEIGMHGLILTAKHHDGFCLWPTKTTEHDIAKSPFRGGKGDVVREVADACRRHGLGFGVYLSPWDRNHADYGKPSYVDVYRAQLRELMTSYGPLFEIWHDGANGGDGFYGGARETRKIDKTRYYDWPTTWAMIRELQPGACVFSDAGPDVRWIGNERGEAGDPCWSVIRREGLAPGKEGIEGRLNSGERDGDAWLPGECDVSIRPGWFWHEAENNRVRTPENLLDLYFKSVGRGASFLLNVPPDRRGRWHENDVAALRGFAKLRDALFARELSKGAKVEASASRRGFAPKNLLEGKRETFWAAPDGTSSAELTLTFKKPGPVGVVRFAESLPLGQRIDSWAVDVRENGAWKEIGAGQSIGNCRLVRGNGIVTDAVRLRILKASAAPCLTELRVYRAV